MKIIRNHLFPLGSYKAMTLGPFIFCHHGFTPTPADINHEAIHWQQQKELLIVFFLLLYVLFFLWECFRCLFCPSRGKSPYGYRRTLWKRAYRSIAFEREAYTHETDLSYLRSRKHYAWL